MAKKLTEDQIKWILSVESTEAQQGIRALTKANRELENANKDRRKELIRLEMQGKKGTAEYKNLNAVIQQNNDKIAENRAIIKGLEDTLSLTELTMGQLKKRAQELGRQLDNTSKSLNPDEYDKLEKELGDVKNRMTQLRDEGKQAENSLGSMIRKKGAVATFFGNIYTAVGKFILDSAKKIKDFIVEGTRMAGMAQGIDYAFNHIANRDYLKSLREQTKGLISDLTLMKSAVRAENFNIPLEKLGTLLQFAQNRARDTGENVDYLVESIINGIGRKSPLILDNLGISAVRLQEEVKKTGDFAGAVGKIVQEEMAKAGPAIDTAADAATRKKVAWENLQLTVGKFFVGFSAGWDNMMATFASGLESILKGNEDAKKSYDDQIKKVADLEVNTAELVKRYEELKSKTNLNKKEQAELNRIMNTISQTIPGVTNEFDRYGNALSINTSKVWAFIAAEREKLKVMNKEAIGSVKEKFNNTNKELMDVNDKIAAGGKTVSYQTSSLGTSDYTFVPYTTQEMDDLKKRQAELKGNLLDFNEQIMYLDGTSTEIQLKNERERVNSRNRFNAMNKKQLAAWLADEKNAKNEYRDIAQEVYNMRFGDGVSSSDDKTKGKPYEKELKRLDEELKSEQALIKASYDAKKIDQNDFFKKSLEKEQEFLNKKLQIKNLEESDRKGFQDKLLANLDSQKQLEEMKLKEQFASDKISKIKYQQEMEQLERDYLFKKMDLYNLDTVTQMQIQDKIFEYKIKMLEQTKKIENDYFVENKKNIDKQNKELSKQNAARIKEILSQAEIQQKKEFDKKVEANKRLVDLTAAFSTEIGTLVGNAMSGNKDMIKDSIVSLINIGLDFLKIQTQMAIAGATIQSLASPESIATWGAAGIAKKLVIVGLIEAAFQAAKVMVGSIASKIGGFSSSSSSSSGTTRVLAGREDGGFMDVERMQDGRKYRATYAPARRGYVDRPTVIVGEGGQEWIAPKDALDNPTISPLIELLEQSRLQGTIRTIDLNQIMRARMAGFSSGGYLNDNPLAEAMRSGANATDPALFIRKDGSVTQSDKTIVELNKTLKKLQEEGVSVNYRSFENAKKIMENLKTKAARS